MTTLNIIGVGNVKSEGLRKGSIVDIDETVHSIKKAIEQAERMIGMEIRQVIVGITGNQCYTSAMSWCCSCIKSKS